MNIIISFIGTYHLTGSVIYDMVADFLVFFIFYSMDPAVMATTKMYTPNVLLWSTDVRGYTYIIIKYNTFYYIICMMYIYTRVPIL